MIKDGICWDKIRAKDKQEIEQAVTKYYKVGYLIAHKWAKGGHLEESEALGLSHLALMKCLDKATYDETRNVKFSSYLGNAVHNEIRMYLRKDRRMKAKISSMSLDQLMPTDDENLTYGDLLIQSLSLEEELEDKFLLEEANQILKEVAKGMTIPELKCLFLYLEGTPIKNIGKKIGVSESHGHTILYSIQDRLRKKRIEREQ